MHIMKCKHNCIKYLLHNILFYLYVYKLSLNFSYKRKFEKFAISLLTSLAKIKIQKIKNVD